MGDTLLPAPGDRAEFWGDIPSVACNINCTVGQAVT